MKDYLEIYEKFKYIKDISDYIEEVKFLRYYFCSKQFQQMQLHINKLIKKYYADAIIWNSVNTHFPTSPQQAYINASNFMEMQGVKLIINKVLNFKEYITQEENCYIEAIIKLINQDRG